MKFLIPNIVDQSQISNLTKGRTLERLSKSLVGAKFKVPLLYILEVKRWLDQQEMVHAELCDIFGDQLFVVRSSASDEDGVTSAKAREYESVLEVNVRDLKGLNDARSLVIRSYEKAGISSVNQGILIQEMVQNTI